MKNSIGLERAKKQAIEATGKSPSETRTELVQLASVVISTIEAIDKEQRNG